MSDPTAELPLVVLDALMPTSQRQVLNRRGSSVWEVEGDRGRHAVKLGYPILATAEWPGQEWTATAPAREAYVLNWLRAERTLYGEWELGTWNVQPWHEGPDLWELWKPCRVEGSTVEPKLDVALSCAEALADLHIKGWAHGDVQPAHFIIGHRQAQLIDLALAHGQPIVEAFDFPFRGCLVHYEAPEISRSVLADGTAVPTPEADVYALGAAFFISATGTRAVAYPDDAPRPVQRQAVVDGPHRPVTVPGAFGELIEEMLRPNPADRPTIGEVCKALHY